MNEFKIKKANYYMKIGQHIGELPICTKCKVNILEHPRLEKELSGAKGGKVRKRWIKKLITIDHIHEKSDGGTDKKENLQLLCRDCHAIKTKIFCLRRLELGIKLDEAYSHILNRFFLDGRFQFVKVDVDCYKDGKLICTRKVKRVKLYDYNMLTMKLNNNNSS